MGVRMKVDWDDGKNVLAAGDKCYEFSPSFEARLVRAGLAEEVPATEALDDMRFAAGMSTLSDDPPATMEMLRAELVAMAEERGIETDGTKAELVDRINAAS